MHDKKNIFQLWKDNNEKLPFNAIIDSWDESKHYVVVEDIEISSWPYGKATGQYFFNGTPGEKGSIKNAGTYRWKFKI